jgi:hypothetical protein
VPAPLTHPDAPVRRAMLGVVEFFLDRARELEGIQRIALVGSITEPKREPKDIDLLVYASSQVPLASLARLGRRARGRLQSINRGCDVFLADPDNGYVGRLCIWTRCGPGFRASCDARHCGQREFLHDDFDEIRLADDLISDPPVELWPRPFARRSVPTDVQVLLDRLACSHAGDQ